MSNRMKPQADTEHTPQRAQGLDPEITAQPRSIADEIALEASAEPELSVDPDDLGSRFLRDATEQGDFDPQRAWSGDSSLYVSPAGDQALAGSNFVAGNTVWEQTVDLATRTQGAAELLREPAPPAAADSELEADEEQQDTSELTRAAQAGIRELSLFDDEAAPAADALLDEQGSHTRMGSRQTFGQAPRSKASPREQAQPWHQPMPPAPALLRAALVQCAAMLRALAERMQRYASRRAAAPRVSDGHASEGVERQERKLDEAIEMTFPASDPISI